MTTGWRAATLVVSFAATAAALLAGCTRRERTLTVHHRLIDGLGQDGRVAALPPRLTLVEGTRAEVRSMSVHGDARPSLVLPPPARVRTRVEVPFDGELRFGVVVRPVEAEVTLRVAVQDRGSARSEYEERWSQQRAWSDRRVDLRRYAGRVVSLDVSIDGPPGATVALGQPEIVGWDADGPRPNVVLYVVDCLRADHVGAYGYPRPTTPEIDRLARDGVVFEKTYACAAWTKPSVGCLFTSLYPIHHGARTLDDALDPDVRTVAELFQAAGYSTHAFVANPVVDKSTFGFGRGFDRFVELARRSAGRNVNSVPADAAQINDVIPWLEDNRDRRFFLYLHSLDLHFPYDARSPFDRELVRPDATGIDRERDLYDSEIAYNDREVGRLIEALEDLGLYEQTAIVVTSDHGEEFLEHGTDRHGRSLYDELLHVPWILKPPGPGPRAVARVGALASNLDVAPTLLDYAGLPVPGSFLGLSLRPAVEGAPPPPGRRLFAEQIGAQHALYALRDERFKYIYELIPEPREMFFDVSKDPREQRNLLPAAAEAAEGFAEAVRSFMQQGLEGYHVLLARPGPAARLKASTTGRFTDVLRLVVRTGDEVRLSDDRRSVELDVGASGPARHVVLRTEPAGAALSLGLFTAKTPFAPASVRLGGTERTPASMPFRVEAEAVATTSAAPPPGGSGVGARVFYLKPPSHVALAPDPELRERLRALGYVR